MEKSLKSTFNQSNQRLQTSLGSKISLLTHEELQQRFPWINSSDVVSASLGIEGEGWLDPYSFFDGI